MFFTIKFIPFLCIFEIFLFKNNLHLLSKKYILIFFLLIIGADNSFLFAQNFDSIRSKYESFEENNDTALPFVKKYIDKAKKEKDYPHLSQGYLDAGYYNSNINLKFKLLIVLFYQPNFPTIISV